MSKMAVCLLALAVVAAVQAAAVPLHQTDIEKAAQSGNWALVHQLIIKDLKLRRDPYGDLGGQGVLRVAELSPLDSDSIFFTDVRNLKAPTDRSGRVYGKAESTFRSTTNNNGDVQENGGGYKIINDNGKVTEFSFNPFQ